MTAKKFIHFFNDHEVRAVWDEESSKWLKGKMAKDGIQLVCVTNHFKLMAPDGKQRAADALDAEAVQTLAQNYPNNRANAFLNW